MQNYNWNYPTTMWVGENRINDIAAACKNLGITKPLLVTDKGLAETDIVKKTLSILDNNKVVNQRAPLSQIKILHFKEKNDWNLSAKYNIGKSQGNGE